MTFVGLVLNPTPLYPYLISEHYLEKGKEVFDLLIKKRHMKVDRGTLE